MRIADGARKLCWTQPKAMEKRFVLTAGDEEVATLAFRSAFGTLATGASADGRWTFKRVGFFRNRVTVREASSDRDLAAYLPNTWSQGGTLNLPDGRAIQITTNVWQTRIEFLGPGEERLIHFSVGGLMRLSAEVEILPAAARLAELPWLVMLGCYLVVNMHDDASAVVTVAAIS